MAAYKSAFMDISNDDGAYDTDTVVEKLHDFCVDCMTIDELYDLFTLSRDELVSMLKSKYNLCSFYTVVFSTVAQQLEHFEMTGIGLDAPELSDNTAEVEFERKLKFDARGRGFYMNVVNRKDDSINETVLRIFLNRMVSLAGPTLLLCSDLDEKRHSDGTGSNGDSPSFKSDRRVIRLIIARCWADKLLKRYTAINNNEIGICQS